MSIGMILLALVCIGAIARVIGMRRDALELEMLKIFVLQRGDAQNAVITHFTDRGGGRVVFPTEQRQFAFVENSSLHRADALVCALNPRLPLARFSEILGGA